MSELTDWQQRVIGCEMWIMSPKVVNEILADMNKEEANRFLEKLSYLRAKDIYDRETRRDKDTG